MTLRVATYNIHRCVGSDGIESRERIAAVLSDIDADVAALQEVAFDPADPKNILRDLAQSMDATAISGPTLLEKKGQYGNALLSRIAPDSVDRLDISVPGREPRGALSVRLRLNDVIVRIVATHLGLRPGERRYQIRRLLSLLEDSQVTVTILLGDFNEWFLWRRPLRWLNRRFGRMPAPATYPSFRPLLALDRIWVDPTDRLTSMYLYRHPPAVTASDHLPVVANLVI